MGSAKAVKQDPHTRNPFYVGTGFGSSVSLEEGKTFKPFMTALPVMRVDEVLVHPRDNDLILSSHGRSVWIMDDITPLQALNPTNMAMEVAFFEPRSAVLWKQDIRMRRSVTGNHNFEGEN